MHRETWDEIVECADCGTPIDVALERGYRGAGDWALCLTCALKRGGQFDENEDSWTVAPDVTGLRPDDEHKVR